MWVAYLVGGIIVRRGWIQVDFFLSSLLRRVVCTVWCGGRVATTPKGLRKNARRIAHSVGGEARGLINFGARVCAGLRAR